ncbi:MAG: TIGR04282 family arsenosugar biosynthesis glycosyltransferase [Chloroflexota bacterium]
MAEERLLLAVVCRNPDIGTVKTRLIPALGEEGARALYRAFLQDLGTRFAGQPYDLLWAHTPEGGPPPAALVRGSRLAQEGPDLGHRLLHIFRQALAGGYGRVVVTSSDVPHLSQEVVEAAFTALASQDVVLAPSEDGGYHLVGMREPHDIFTMVPMSTPTVFTDTRKVLIDRALRHEVLAGDFDVDLPEDLPRLARRLAEDPALHESHTARELRVRLAVRCSIDSGREA